MRSTKRLKKAAARRRAQAKKAVGAGVRVAWRLPDGTVKDVHDIGPHPEPGEPSVQILLDPSARAMPPEWFTDDDRAKADRNVDAAVADGWPVEPELLAARKQRGQRPPAPPEPVWCKGGDPACTGCQAVDAATYSRKRQSDAPRPAVGLNFKPLGVRFS